MKKIFIALTLGFFSFAQNSSAQTIAQDWTKTDCDGTEHHLYAELDAGNVVVMDFAMTHCVPCAVATTAFQKLDEKFGITNPGKLKHYGMGYINSYTCDDLNGWKSDNNFDLPVMTQCASDVAFYGGMGMPTIVIVGPDHKVYYKKQGFVQKDTVAMIAAIQKAFGSASVASGISRNDIRVAGFGAEQSLQFSLREPLVADIQIFDMLGKISATLASNSSIPQGQYVLPLKQANLHSGTYIIRIAAKSGEIISLPLSIAK